MKTINSIKVKTALSLIIAIVFPFCFCWSQDAVQLPQPSTVGRYGYDPVETKPTRSRATSGFLTSNQAQHNAAIIKGIETSSHSRDDLVRGEMQNDIAELKTASAYQLPSHDNMPGAKSYESAFQALLSVNVNHYSIADLNFTVENAFFDNKVDRAAFLKIVKKSGDFLRAKMQELKYDPNSNLAKNYILFQFFAQKMKLKATGREHFPFKYDFNDYMGQKDWSNMFVTKLIQSGSGQCHSLPLFYLIMAEEIGAEAYLALSPNHSYIKFQDDKGKWYNLELTNGMFTTNSFILNSGFLKAEAMQNKIYMQSLNRRQLLSTLMVDLAAGYQHKFGYDTFFETIIKKSLDLYPENITANQMLANYHTARFEYAMKQLGINPHDNQDLQRIRNYPKAVALLNETNSQYKKIDDLGFEFMSAEAYKVWLASLKQAKNKQDSQDMSEQFRGVIKQKTLD